MDDTVQLSTLETEEVVATPVPNSRGLDRRSERGIEKALRRAALRKMKAEKREQYALEDAKDREALAIERHAQNERDDARGEIAWKASVERELASAERRARWVELHSETAEAKKTVRDAQREARAKYRELEDARRAEMRMERLEDEDREDETKRAAASKRLDAMTARHEAWLEAGDVEAKERRAAKAVLRQKRDERRAQRPETLARENHERALRNEAADARGEAIRTAVREHAFATAMRLEAQRSGTPEELETARAREAELKAVEEQVRQQAREEQAAESKALREARQAAAAKRKAEKDEICKAWRAAKAAKAEERRKMRLADREVRAGEKAEDAALTVALREERNERNEARAVEGRKLNERREMILADIRKFYFDCLEIEREELRRAAELDKPARETALTEERALAKQHRAERSAELEAGKQIVRTRALQRAQDRAAASKAANDAYHYLAANWPTDSHLLEQ